MQTNVIYHNRKYFGLIPACICVVLGIYWSDSTLTRPLFANRRTERSAIQAVLNSDSNESRIKVEWESKETGRNSNRYGRV